MFITLEGPDGVGKTTQVNGVYQALREIYLNVVKTREPGGTPAAEAIRGLLLNPDINLLPETEVKLHFAARHEHIEGLIKPAIAEGGVVLCDRFFDSTMAYQHYGLGVSKDLINAEIKTLSIVPDLTIVLFASWDVCLKRRMQRDPGKGADRYEQWSDDRAKRVFSGYLEIAKENPERCVLIHCDHTPEYITGKIMEIIQRSWQEKHQNQAPVATAKPQN